MIVYFELLLVYFSNMLPEILEILHSLIPAMLASELIILQPPDKKVTFWKSRANNFSVSFK